jgi:hypothetical protein
VAALAPASNNTPTYLLLTVFVVALKGKYEAAAFPFHLIPAAPPGDSGLCVALCARGRKKIKHKDTHIKDEHL